jgi:glycosyltransferase involved in cell wall biosynthesis
MDISIIIPFYKNKSRLLILLNSLYVSYCKSEVKPLVQIIIVNDSPPINISKEINSFINELYFDTITIEMISNRKNKGVAFSRNFGRSLAKGKFLTFIDQDDYVEEIYFNEISKLTNESFDICILNAFHVWENYNIKIKMYTYSPAFTLSNLLKNSEIITPGLLIFKNEWFVFNFDCYDLNAPGSDDWALYLNICNTTIPLIKFIKKPIFNYVTHNDNVSSNKLNLIKSSILTLNNFQPKYFHVIYNIKLKLLKCELFFHENKNSSQFNYMFSKLSTLLNKIFIININNLLYYYRKNIKLRKK